MADKAIQKDGSTKRYLPEKAWASLSKKEREETDAKKRAGSRKGKQFVSNTEKAKKQDVQPDATKIKRKSKKLVKKAIKNAHLYSRAEILYFKMWLELKKQAKTAKINKDK